MKLFTAMVSLVSLAHVGAAHAGGTGTSTGPDPSTSGTTTDDGGSSGAIDEAGATSSTGSAAAESTSETTDGTCDICGPSTNAGDIVFGNLGDGTPPAGEKVVQVWAEPKCRCEDCVCYDDDASQIRLELDGDPVGQPCASAQCEFVVTLTPGTHALTAIARYDFGEVSASVQIVVPGEGGSSETGAPMEDASADGCGCRADAGRTGPGMLALALVGIFARRRSRRR